MHLLANSMLVEVQEQVVAVEVGAEVVLVVVVVVVAAVVPEVAVVVRVIGSARKLTQGSLI
jgi:hypothetical protein